VGQDDTIDLLLMCAITGNHALLLGVPGLAKTLMVKALASTFSWKFSRIQFTPDLMPSDITGYELLQSDSSGMARGQTMVFRPGPVFGNLILADEINRAAPKTQSALLEAMQERCVTLLGTTRPLPAPFFVLASQNPIELEGTYPLPEAQLDRFLFKLNVPGAEVEVLDRIIATRRRGEPPAPTWKMSAAELDKLYAAMEKIFLPRPVARYIARLVAATHPASSEAPEPVRKYVAYGASPRAAIALAEACRGQALLAGRPTAGFEDVKAVAVPVLNHRLILNYKARLDQVTALTVVGQLLAGLDETGLNLPDDVTVTGS
jgi:MoxR-like ATPase